MNYGVAHVILGVGMCGALAESTYNPPEPTQPEYRTFFSLEARVAESGLMQCDEGLRGK